MKTITLEAGERIDFERAVLEWGRNNVRSRTGRPQQRTWLPVPPFTAVQPLPELRSAAPARRSANIWLTPPRETFGERFLMLTLSVAALAGIGYGLSLLLDLVEGWAAFHATVASLLQ